MTNHANLIAALRIPMNVTIPGAPELDEYDEQRKAAADALEAVWAEATAAAYGAAANEAVMLCPVCGGTGREDDAECGDISFNTWVCRSCKGDKVLPNESILALTPQSTRDWLAAHDAEVYRRGQEDMRERAALICREAVFEVPMDDAELLRNRALIERETEIRALPIKEKDDE